MNDSTESGTRKYIVEITLDATEEAADRIEAAWDWVMAQMSELAARGQLFLAMPAIVREQSQPSSPLRLRWAGIYGVDSNDAAAQACGVLETLATFLPALKAPILDTRAWEEGS